MGMRLQRIRANTRVFALAGAIGLLAAPAAAQEEGGEEAPAEEVPDLDAPEGEAAPARQPGPAAAAEGDPQVSETHNVQGGDTLWDLCSKYLNSPWYWPKIWSYNPQITNPHWIYPGNELRFYPSDENLPTNVEVSRSMELEDQEAPVLPDDVVSTSRSLRVGTIAQNSVYRVHVAFVEAADHQRAGTIEAAFADSFLLSPYQKAYVKFNGAAKPGDDYAIYRTVKEIEHPVTGEPYGHVVELIGTVKVLETSEGVAGVEIQRTFKEVERGDWVGPWPESASQRISPTPNQGNAKGYVIETMEVGVGAIAEHHVVFIDRGRAQGVQVGNIFTVLQRGDAYLEEVEGLPNEDVGKLLVIDVRENAATAVVIRSIQDLNVGDKVEMRSGDS